MRPTIKGFHPKPLRGRHPQRRPQEVYDTRRHRCHRCQNAGLLPRKTIAHTHKSEHLVPPSPVFKTRSKGCHSRRAATTKVSRYPLLTTQINNQGIKQLPPPCCSPKKHPCGPLVARCNIPGCEARNGEEAEVCIAFMHRKSGKFSRFK
jgi:hypothetical protein